MNRLIEELPYLWGGLLVTLKVTAMAWVIMVVLAFLLAVGRAYGPTAVRWLCTGVVETFRGTATLVMLFWAFYVMPQFGVTLSPMFTGVVVLGVAEACYASEIVRGSLLSVPRGQWEAAHVLGLRGWRRMVRVILPQAVPTMVPPFGNLSIALLKFTALLSFISVHDLTGRAQDVRYEIGQSVLVFGFLLVIYYLLSSTIAFAFRLLEKRVMVTGRGRADMVRDRKRRGATQRAGAEAR
ncbi:ectoine/hydroxyectoine ABC transporter permease subunit EhuC [Dactylosporangium sp. NPDC000555]|uniref:ectoine/hydroxyectoine ABC transporter permease subunit EhuC n=1 Tax=Dactylosporangium sp. NPDC000555 TaxID=3154260 RepID=UPI003333FE93